SSDGIPPSATFNPMGGMTMRLGTSSEPMLIGLNRESDNSSRTSATPVSPFKSKPHRPLQPYGYGSANGYHEHNLKFARENRFWFCAIDVESAGNAAKTKDRQLIAAGPSMDLTDNGAK